MHRFIVLLGVLFVSDRLLKNIIWFSQYGDSRTDVVSRTIVPFINPTLNANISFSLKLPGLDDRALTALLTAIVIGLVFILCVQYRNRDVKNLFVWGLIVIGASSNLLDRYVLGGVFDYIDLGFFPVFNMSDVYISLGTFLLLFNELIVRRKVPAENSNNGSRPKSVA